MLEEKIKIQEEILKKIVRQMKYTSGLTVEWDKFLDLDGKHFLKYAKTRISFTWTSDRSDGRICLVNLFKWTISLTYLVQNSSLLEDFGTIAYRNE